MEKTSSAQKEFENKRMSSPIIVPRVTKQLENVLQSRNYNLQKVNRTTLVNKSTNIEQQVICAIKPTSMNVKDFFQHLLPMNQAQSNKKPTTSIGAKRLLLHKRGVTPSYYSENQSIKKKGKKSMRDSFNSVIDEDKIRLPSISCCLNYSILPKQSAQIKDYIAKNQKSAKNTNQIAKLFSKGLNCQREKIKVESKLQNYDDNNNQQSHRSNNSNSSPQKIVLSKPAPSDYGQNTSQINIIEEDFDKYSISNLEQNRYSSSRLNLLQQSSDKIKISQLLQQPHGNINIEKKVVKQRPQQSEQIPLQSVNWSFDSAFRQMAAEKLRSINLSTQQNNVALKNVNVNYAMEIAQEKMRSFYSVWGPQIRIMQRFMKTQVNSNQMRQRSLNISHIPNGSSRNTSFLSVNKPQTAKSSSKYNQRLKYATAAQMQDQKSQSKDQLLSPMQQQTISSKHNGVYSPIQINQNEFEEQREENNQLFRLSQIVMNKDKILSPHQLDSQHLSDSINLVINKPIKIKSNQRQTPGGELITSNDHSKQLSMSTYMEYISSPQMKNNFFGMQENCDTQRDFEL